MKFVKTERDLLKYVSKIYRLNFEIVAVTRPCIRFFVIQIAFQSSDRAELDFWRFVIKISFNVKSQGNKKLKFSPKGLTTPKI